MLYSGYLYTGVMLFGFLLTKLRHIPEYVTISPGYWHPETLFNLGRLSGGLALEDILFMFVSAGLVVGFSKRFGKLREDAYMSFAVASICSIVFLYFTHINLMYSLIFFYVAGAIYFIAKEKFSFLFFKEMLQNSFAFGFVYFLLFYIFITLFPTFVVDNYNLASYLNSSFLGVPIAEIMHGLAFGAYWSMLFENKV